MKQLLTTLLLSSLAGFISPVNAEKQPTSDQEKFSYAIGIQLAQSIYQQDIQIDADSLIQAVTDILKQQDLKLTIPEMQQAIANYQAQQAKRMSELAIKNQAEGDTFLTKNKTQPGIIELESGLQYKIEKQGSGKKPTQDDSVVVHYRGALINGQVFDSSYERGQPITLALNRVIKGWQEALPLMPTGSKWKIYVPSELGYGEQGAGANIPPNSTLVFDIELISIN